MAIISDELREVKALFAVPRRTEIADWSGDMEDEDLIEREDMVVTITSGGYIKRTPLPNSAARTGAARASPRCRPRTTMSSPRFSSRIHILGSLFFTTDGMVYKLKTWRLPLAGRTAKGKALVNILPIGPGISIAALMPVDVPEEDWGNLQIVFATSDGDVRQNDLSDFTNVMRNGKIAMKLPEGITLVNAAIADDQDDVMLVTEAGRAIRFSTTEIRVFKSRGSTGVRGIRLAAGDHVVSMSIIRHFEATPEEREAYLKQRRLMAGITEDETDDEEETVQAGQLSPRTLQRDVGRRRPDPDRHQGRLGQALLQPRLPRPGPWRHGRQGHLPGPARRPHHRLLPGRPFRPDHARHLHRPVDPHPRGTGQLPLAVGRRRPRLRHRRG
jgi:DNA gyrase subunit A